MYICTQYFSYWVCQTWRVAKFSSGGNSLKVDLYNFAERTQPKIIKIFHQIKVDLALFAQGTHISADFKNCTISHFYLICLLPILGWGAEPLHGVVALLYSLLYTALCIYHCTVLA